MKCNDNPADDMSVGDESTGENGGVERRAQLARALACGGMEGVQILSQESADTVLTPNRREIIEVLWSHDIESVRDLSRQLDRDKGQVSRDLAVLAEHAVIGYDGCGRTKHPYLTQDYIVVEPL